MASLSDKLFGLSRRRGSISLRMSVALLLSLCLFSLSGCGNGLINSLSELAHLRNELIEEFHDPDVQVAIHNSTVLTITFVNSPLNAEDSSTERFARAVKTTDFVQQHYAGMDRIETLWVAFVEAETHFLVFTYSRGIDAYPFDGKGKLLRRPSQYDSRLQSDSEDHAQAAYNQTRDETDVHITRLQLAGDLDRGLALAPHFTVHGHLSDGHATMPPTSVILDFASFAPRKVFKSDPALIIVADGKTLSGGKARNASAETEGGNEFLSQQIPFDLFAEITRAEKVVLKLADNEYSLSTPQLEQLRKMASYGTPAKH